MFDHALARSPTTTPQAASRVRFSLRLLVIVLVAVTACLPIFWVSLSKVLLFVTGLFWLLHRLLSKKLSDEEAPTLWTSVAVLGVLLAFACSLLWTEADLANAVTGLVRHAKLLTIVLLASLIRSRQEARLALGVFAVGQTVYLLSSWMLFVGLPVPWAMEAATPYIVFSSYLDQGIMFAINAGIAWHLRHEKLWHPILGGTYAVLALANVLLLLEGRAGYLIALALLTLAAAWALPKHFRLLALVVTPTVLSAALWVGSQQVQQRVSRLVVEATQFTKTGVVADQDSAAFRLNAWYRSVQGIQEKPWVGHGVGAWSPTVKRLQGAQAEVIFGVSALSNPHQEFLLWAVELGVGGALLLAGLMVAIAADARRLPVPVQRATLSVLAAMLIACLFNSALFDDLLGDFFCVSLGLLLALGRHGLAQPPSNQAWVASPATSQSRA